MTQTNDWRRKYFTEEQLQKAEEWNKKYYTEEQRQQLAEWGKDFTEEDQQVASQKWSEVGAELKRLVEAGQDPGTAEAQALAKQWLDLLHQFTHGDPGIQQGLNKMYADLSETPAEEAPYSVPYSQEEGAFIQKAIEIYQLTPGASPPPQ